MEDKRTFASFHERKHYKQTLGSPEFVYAQVFDIEGYAEQCKNRAGLLKWQSHQRRNVADFKDVASTAKTASMSTLSNTTG